MWLLSNGQFEMTSFRCSKNTATRTTARLGNILGEQIVDVAAERIRHELFDDGQEDALIQGLLAPFADISTSTEAISSEESQAGVDEDEEGDES